MTQTRGRIYWANCQVCQYMKRNPTMREQVLSSSYYNPNGNESLIQVFKRWNAPFPTQTIYSHMRRHQSKPVAAIELAAPVQAVPIEDLEEVTPRSGTAHERGLDEIISKGRNMIRSGELKLTTSALLTAIKTKSEIEKSKKDQGLEAMKLMAGAFGGNDGATDTGTAQISD